MVISGNTEISLLLFYIFQDNHLICAAFGFLFFSVENFLFDNQQKEVKEAEGGGGQRKKKRSTYTQIRPQLAKEKMTFGILREFLMRVCSAGQYSIFKATLIIVRNGC